MLTIAHRVNTIIDSDRVAVLQEGVLVEFDTPLKLLRIPDGKFADMVKRQGETFYNEMVRIAMAHDEAASGVMEGHSNGNDKPGDNLQ